MLHFVAQTLKKPHKKVLSGTFQNVAYLSGVISDLFRNCQNISEMLNQVQHDVAATISPLTQH